MARERTARARLGAYEFRKKGVSRYDFGDPYHLAVSATWPQFLAALTALYLIVNAFFATLFALVPGCVENARPGSYLDVFFFSFETLGTVGYGAMHPATSYGHVVASVEILCGLAFSAILTGLMFVRFSWPRAKFVFADNPVVTRHNGQPTLMLRVGNGRAAVMADARAQLNILIAETTAEGKPFRRAQELPLERTNIPIFPLAWTIMHAIDENSPLFGMDEAAAIAAEARLFVAFQARDPTLATVVHDIRNYAPGDIRFGMRYVNAVTTEPDGSTVVDLNLISALEPDGGDYPSNA